MRRSNVSTRRLWQGITIGLGWSLLVAACGGGQPAASPTTVAEGKETTMSLHLTSMSFEAGGAIPPEYTCQGDNISPHLEWSGVPPHTRSLALIVDDPDAPSGEWVHWVLFDIPPEVAELQENQPDLLELPNGARNGRNSFKNLGYGGPCPPPGKAHRYFFKLYALDRRLNLESGATKEEVMAAMAGHVLAEGQIMGTYQRQ